MIAREGDRSKLLSNRNAPPLNVSDPVGAPNPVSALTAIVPWLIVVPPE